MMLLCGLAAKHTPVFSELTAPFLRIGGNAPQHEDFQPHTMWSLSNAFTSPFKELDPIPQFKATAKLGPYLEHVRGSDRRGKMCPDFPVGTRPRSTANGAGRPLISWKTPKGCRWSVRVKRQSAGWRHAQAATGASIPPKQNRGHPENPSSSSAKAGASFSRSTIVPSSASTATAPRASSRRFTKFCPAPRCEVTL
jgi:hypothetical protein